MLCSHYNTTSPNSLDLLDESIDLYDFCRLIYESSDDPDLRAGALDVMNAIQDDPDPSQRYILLNLYLSAKDIDSIFWWDLDDSHGVSIFFTKPNSRRSFYSGGTLAFAAGTAWTLGPESMAMTQADDTIQWGPMLVQYVSEVYPDAPDDPTEPALMPAEAGVGFSYCYLPYLARGY